MKFTSTIVLALLGSASAFAPSQSNAFVRKSLEKLSFICSLAPLLAAWRKTHDTVHWS